MKRKAVTLAVAGALGVPVAAFAQNVQIYGKLYPELTYAKTTGATAPGTPASQLSTIQKVAPAGDLKPRLSQDTGNSYIGFRGSEDLGSGLKAIFQIEQNANVDASGANNVFASRDSFLGLTGGFGTIRLGNMDTVYKRIGDPMAILGVSSGNFVSSSNILAKPGFGSSSASSFNLRRANSLAYESPTFGGVQILAQWSPDEGRFASAAGLPSTTEKNAYLTSVGAKFEMGGLYLALANERHRDTFGGSANVPTAIANPTDGSTVHSMDMSTRASASYEIGGTKFGGDFATTEYKEDGAATGHFERYKHNTWLVGVQQKVGNITAALNYGSASAGTCSLAGGAACSTGGLEGKLIAAGLGLSLSKRTLLFALAAWLNNGDSATYNNLTNADAPVGGDITQFALGVSHSF